MSRSLRDETKDIVNALLVPYPAGIFLNLFLREFHTAEGRDLPFRELGHNTPLELLLSMPDAVRCIRVGEQIIIQAVPNQSNMHLKEMVVRQNKHKNAMLQRMKEITGHSVAHLQHGIPSLQAKMGTKFDFTIPPPQLKPASDLHAGLAKKLEELLSTYPNGIQLREVLEFFEQRLGVNCKSLDLKQFFYVHVETFRVWKEGEVFMVGLNQFLKNREVPAKHSQFKLDEEARIAPEPSVQSLKHPQKRDDPPKVMTGREQEPRSPRRKSLAGSSLRERPAEVRDRKPLRYSVHDDEANVDLPPNFGIPKPALANVYVPGVEMKRQVLPDAAVNANPNDYFFIIIAEIYTPAKFYWFLKDSRQAIEKLSDDMTLFYHVNDQDGYRMSQDEVYITQIVAVLFTDNLWYRGQVISFPGKQLIEVFYIDYGTITRVRVEQLRHLHLKFAELPIQAFRGRLYGLKPPRGEMQWPEESSKHFLNLVKGSKPLAAACMKRESLKVGLKEAIDVYVLDIVDTTTDVDMPLINTLIEGHHAENNPSETHQAGNQPIKRIDLGQREELGAHASPVKPATPQPSCPFPCREERERSVAGAAGISVPSRGTNSFNPERTNHPDVNLLSSLFPTLSTSCDMRSAIVAASKSKQVKIVDMIDGRRYHIIKPETDSSMVYISGVELARIIPHLQSERALDKALHILDVNIEPRVITYSEHWSIFIECASLRVPWVVSDNEIIDSISLYELKLFSVILRVLGHKDPLAEKVFKIEALNPHWV